MRYRNLGNTGLKVSEVGFGAWGIGGPTKGEAAYGPTDDKVSRRALRRAYEEGVTFYDTSDLYGYGHSEELIGAELGDVRKNIVIASKVGFLEHGGPQDFSAEHIKSSLEKSLTRLKTDYIDLYQLHSPSIEEVVANPEIIKTMISLVDSGKIRAYGISIRRPEDGLIAVDELGFRSVQVNLNLTDQRALDTGLLALADRFKAGIIARTPLSFGFLSGKLSGAVFSPGDHRLRWPKEQIRRWSEAPDLFKFLHSDDRRTAVQAALQYCLSEPAVATVIPGMLNESQVEENVNLDLVPPLTSIEMDKIHDIYANNFRDEPIRKNDNNKNTL